MHLKVEDVAPHGFTLERASVRQRKTGHPVKFELSEQTREAIDTYMLQFDRRPGQFLFAGRGNALRGFSTRQYYYRVPCLRPFNRSNRWPRQRG